MQASAGSLTCPEYFGEPRRARPQSISRSTRSEISLVQNERSRVARAIVSRLSVNPLLRGLIGLKGTACPPRPESIRTRLVMQINPVLSAFAEKLSGHGSTCSKESRETPGTPQPQVGFEHRASTNLRSLLPEDCCGTMTARREPRKIRCSKTLF